MKRLVIAIGLLAMTFLGGCAVGTKPLQIEPARRTTPISPRFSESYYYFDREQTLYFVMRARADDPTTGQPVDQVATMRVFWRPKGGVTTLSPSALNATFRYVVMTPSSLGMYEGAGFVRVHSKNGDGNFKAQVMGGDLRLTQASANFVDNLGRAHITGNFTSLYNDAKANEMLIAAQREFFARSLVTPATAPANAPATQTAPAGQP